MADYKILPIVSAFYEPIIALADRCFGQNYLTLDDLNHAVIHRFSYVVIYHDVLIGYCIAYPVNQLNINELDGITDKGSLTHHAIVKQLAIEKNFRGKGFGAKLLLTVLTELKQKGYKKVLYPSWNESCPPYFCKKLETTGFKLLNSVSNFWYADSLEKGYHCLICGSPPCHCSLTWYACNTNDI